MTLCNWAVHALMFITNQTLVHFAFPSLLKFDTHKFHQLIIAMIAMIAMI